MIIEHLDDHYTFYGEDTGVRIARNHQHWYSASLPGAPAFRAQVNAAESIAAQRRAVDGFFARLATETERLPHADEALRNDPPAAARALRSPAFELEALAA